ncbi:hypothetical protein U0030_02950 [Brevundimonas bullata]|uniref:ATP-binding cassette domain-containing protein n=1 Tax=Brevundimonas bullata TaxID=13160 RepID=UPI0013B41A35|nr:ATP-binding cassette domain-containing protein [Brevundimonas bullata]WQE37455.1 hypothetical protein U0030_02950 [Brevundimonas bullata]
MADHADARPIRIKTDEIRFADVTFRYAGQRKPLFEHLDVTVPAGQRVGLVGRSGSGKTTASPERALGETLPRGLRVTRRFLCPSAVDRSASVVI